MHSRNGCSLVESVSPPASLSPASAAGLDTRTAELSEGAPSSTSGGHPVHQEAPREEGVPLRAASPGRVELHFGSYYSPLSAGDVELLDAIAGAVFRTDDLPAYKPPRGPGRRPRGAARRRGTADSGKAPPLAARVQLCIEADAVPYSRSSPVARQLSPQR